MPYFSRKNDLVERTSYKIEILNVNNFFLPSTWEGQKFPHSVLFVSFTSQNLYGSRSRYFHVCICTFLSLFIFYFAYMMLNEIVSVLPFQIALNYLIDTIN